MIYRAKDLEDMPTLSVGQADDLKIDEGKRRVWLCRCGIADGMPYNNQITIERYIDNKWQTVETYEG